MEKKNLFKLNEIKKRVPFTVPENYFEDFAQEIQAQTSAKKTVVVSFSQKIRPFLYVAASLLVLISVTFVALNTKQSAEQVVVENTKDTLPAAENPSKQSAVVAKNEKATKLSAAVVTEEPYYINDIDDDELFDELYAELYDDI